MKRSLSSASSHDTSLVVAATCFIAATYGLVRLAYGLFLPDVQASLGLTTATAGAVSSAASVAYCVGALCGSAAGRRRRVLVAAALTTAVAGSLGMATASGVASFATAAVVASTSAGLASPALVAVVQHHLDGPRGDRAQGVVNSGTGPGLVAAGVLAAALSPDWRTAFVVSAAVSAAAGLAVLLLDGPRGARVRAHGPETRGVLAHRPQRTGPAVWSRLARPAGGALLLGAASAALWTYGRSLLVGAGLGAGWSTAAWIGVGVGGTVTAATAGLLSRRPAPTAWTLTCTGLAAALGLLGVAPSSRTAALLACVLAGWSFVAATTALISWSGEVLPGSVAGATATLFVTLVLGQAVGSTLVGAAAGGHGLPAAFVGAAVVALGASTCGWASSPGAPAPRTDRGAEGARGPWGRSGPPEVLIGPTTPTPDRRRRDGA